MSLKPGIAAKLASAAFNQGGKFQTAGEAVAAAGLLLQPGDLTPAAPATATIGGAGILVGSSFAIGGAAVQGLAGFYYFAHGNPVPIGSTALSIAIGKVFAASPGAGQHPGINHTSENEADVALEAASRKDSHACKPE